MKQTMLLLLALLWAAFTQAQNFWEKVEMPEPGNIGDVITDDNNNLYVTCQNGLFIHMANTNQWRIIPKQQYGYKYLFKIGKTIIATDYNLAFKVNGEINGVVSIGSFPQDALSVLVTKANTVIVGTWGAILKSSDNLQTWDTVFCDFMTLGYVYDLAEDKDGLLYAGSTDYIRELGGLYQSKDGGDIWNYIGLQRHGITSLAISTKNELLIGYYTDSNGMAGITKYNSQTSDFENVVNGNVDVIDLAIDSNNVFYWATQYAMDSSLIIQQSKDNGNNWEGFSEGLDEEVNKIYLSDNGEMYVINQMKHAGIFYGGLYKTNQSIYNGVKNKPSLSLKYFPNPVGKSITISTDLGTNGSILLYNSAGRLILTKDFFNIKNIELDLSTVEPGLYVIEVKQSEMNKTFKIIKE